MAVSCGTESQHLKEKRILLSTTLLTGQSEDFARNAVVTYFTGSKKSMNIKCQQVSLIIKRASISTYKFLLIENLLFTALPIKQTK